MNAEPASHSHSGMPASLHSSISEAGRRIDEVVEAAERVAIERREDARREAEQYLEERRQDADRLVADRAAALSELSDSLVRQVEDLSTQSGALAERIDRIAQEVRQVLEEQVEDDVDHSPPAQAALAEGPAAEEPWESPGEPDDTYHSVEEGIVERPDAQGSEEALLRATQMAISGRSRSEIEAQLRSEFGLEDPEPLLDQVLGPEPR